MGRQIAWDNVPDVAQIPNGMYHLKIEELVDKDSNSGKAMYALSAATVAPIAGMTVWENYVLGTDDNPHADDPAAPATIGARLLKRMLKAAGVPLSEDMDDVCAAAVGYEFLALIETEIDDKPGKYKGRESSKIKSYFALGEREIGLSGDGKPATKAAVKAAPLVAAVKAVNVAVKAVAAAAIAAPVAKKPAGSTIMCELCSPPTAIPRSEFPSHVAAHEE